MKTVEFVQAADDDKMLRVTIPVDESSCRYRVIVRFEPEGVRASEDWPKGFFERTAGQWHGELERAPQGDYPEREEL